MSLLDYVIAAVFAVHVLYFAGCFLVMAGAIVAAPFVWVWQQLRAQ